MILYGKGAFLEASRITMQWLKYYLNCLMYSWALAKMTGKKIVAGCHTTHTNVLGMQWLLYPLILLYVQIGWACILLDIIAAQSPNQTLSTGIPLGAANSIKHQLFLELQHFHLQMGGLTAYIRCLIWMSMREFLRSRVRQMYWLERYV